MKIRKTEKLISAKGAAILLESTLLLIEPPSSRTLEAFLNVFHNTSSGDPYATLGGHSERVYDEKKDLMSLHRSREEDRLTSLIRYTCPWLFVVSETQRPPGPMFPEMQLTLFQKMKQRTDSPLTYISERRLQVFVVVINIILPSALLFGAIYHLYNVTNAKTKLALVAVCTIAFAVCVGLFTNAKRSEVFGACAAYAAVLVVFISGNIGDSSSPPR